MAKKSILKLLIGVLSGPLIIVSRVAEALNLWGIKKDLDRCLFIIDGMNDEIPEVFISVLVVAEDRRSAFHPGIDPIAIFRAVYMTAKGRRQGASTIEQQFVRVIIGRYERSLKRKLREQILAVAVTRHRSKHHIAAAYLSIAFYGSGVHGLKGLKSGCGQCLLAAKTANVIGMVSRLKYPEPLVPTESWRQRISYRNQYIASRLHEENKGSVINTRQDGNKISLLLAKEKPLGCSNAEQQVAADKLRLESFDQKEAKGSTLDTGHFGKNTCLRAAVFLISRAAHLRFSLCLKSAALTKWSG